MGRKVKFEIEGCPNTTAESFFRTTPYIVEKFNLVDSENPDYIFWYNSKFIPPSKKVTNIFYSREATYMKKVKYNWGLGYQYEDEVNNPKYLRYPNYIKYFGKERLIKGEQHSSDKIFLEKTKFCAFVFSHNVVLRNKFFNLLSAYKCVDAPGVCCNNMPPIGKHGSPAASRMSSTGPQELVEFLTPYKFCIVFVNELFSGHTDEKIFLAMQANCIPIFWGNPRIDEEFNPHSFISAHRLSYNTEDEMLKKLVCKVAEIDRDPVLYKRMLAQPWFENNVYNKYFDQNRLINFFSGVFS